MGRPSRYAPEVRERAVRMVLSGGGRRDPRRDVARLRVGGLPHRHVREAHRRLATEAKADSRVFYSVLRTARRPEDDQCRTSASSPPSFPKARREADRQGSRTPGETPPLSTPPSEFLPGRRAATGAHRARSADWPTLRTCAPGPAPARWSDPKGPGTARTSLRCGRYPDPRRPRLISIFSRIGTPLPSSASTRKRNFGATGLCSNCARPSHGSRTTRN